MGNLIITPLAYSTDLIENYYALSHLPGFVLLESSDKERGRYDIVSAYPYDYLKILRNDLNIKSTFDKLNEMLPNQNSLCDLPFQGGAIGYFAYDFAEILAGINAKVHPYNDLPIVDIKFYDWAIIADHHLKSVSLVAANRQLDTKLIINEVISCWKKSSKSYQSFILQDNFTPIITKSSYQQSFEAIHKDLVAGRAYQVNYTQPFYTKYKGCPFEIYKRIRKSNPVPYSAFMRNDDGDVLSFSPEKFITINNGLVETSPIKGTIKRSVDPIIDKKLKSILLTSSKNHAENIMIVDLLRNDLGKFAKKGTVKVKSLCEVQSFTAVHHLVSNIEALCPEGFTTVDVLKATFPGGSITGAPKLEAMRIINEQEPYARGVYCGSIGYFSAHGRFDSNIAIRTIIAKEDTLYLSAGGGIVIDSNWEDEYNECYIKLAAIIKVLEGN